MNTEEFISLNREMGLSLVTAEDGSAWITREDRSLIAIPTLEEFSPSPEVLQKLLKSQGWFASFLTGTVNLGNSFEYIFEGDDYGLDRFDGKTRNQIRKGLKSCQIRPCTADELVSKGLEINQLVLNKQSRSTPSLMEASRWQIYINAFLKHPDVLARAAFVEGALAAYIILVKVNGKYYIYHPFMNYRYSAMCPMNALLYTVINELIEKDSGVRVSYGLSSYLEKPGLDKFKKHMLFNEVTRTRIVIVKPLLSFFLNGATLALVAALRAIRIIPAGLADKFLFLGKSKQEYRRYVSARHS